MKSLHRDNLTDIRALKTYFGRKIPCSLIKEKRKTPRENDLMSKSLKSRHLI